MTRADMEICDEAGYQAAVQALAARARPGWFLRMLMNALERYRQSRKMGWSRPQNKVGLKVFASYELAPQVETEVVHAAFETAESALSGVLTRDDAQFLRALRSDPKLMGFLFVHDLTEGDRRYEGMTFSWGRRHPAEPRFRDRFDVIVESEVTEHGSAGCSRMRVFIDPFRRPVESSPARAFTCLPGDAIRPLFDLAVALHREFSPRIEKHWSHWTSDYIDYFGPREVAVSGTHFPTHVDVVARFEKAG